MKLFKPANTLRRFFQKFSQLAAIAAALCSGAVVAAGDLHAQQIDFSQIDKFESLGNGTLEVGSPPKTIVDDDEGEGLFGDHKGSHDRSTVIRRQPRGAP